MNRHCSRPGCSTQADATLVYDYGRAVVTLEWLADSAHPMSYDLCADHTQRLVVPNGWTVDDHRVAHLTVLPDRPTFLAS